MTTPPPPAPAAPPRATTLAGLRAAGHPDRPLRDELRANLVDRIRRGVPLVPDVLGFEEDVLPSLERALLAGHDVILLGERGQAKTRIVRRLVELLDEWSPAIAGCEINDHPERPACARCRALAAEVGEELPVVWVHREDRFAEKLATPDTSVADLIGDIDPIKVAEGRTLGDEETIHFGLVPRTNRGIVAVNELPDLPERIQVALLNVLEERDVQIRGHTFRLPLDLLLVATANPDDYTNRGRIISPLKDRFGAQVRTHYPRTVADEVAIVRQEAAAPPADVPVHVPLFLDEIVVRLARGLRANPQVNQRSGVSVRYTIGAHETMVAGAVRRVIRTGEPVAVPRVVDLWAVVPAALGRVEFDTLEEGNEEAIVARQLRQAVLEVFRDRFAGVDLAELVARFDEGLVVGTGELVPAADLRAQLGEGADVDGWARRVGVDPGDPGGVASVVELVLEGLHLARRLSKDDQDVEGGRVTYGR